MCTRACAIHDSIALVGLVASCIKILFIIKDRHKLFIFYFCCCFNLYVPLFKKVTMSFLIE